MVRELLGNYVDEELTETMRSAVNDHLASCANCTSDLSSLQATVARLHDAAPVEPASPWFAERLLQSLARTTDTSLIAPEQSKKDMQLGLW